jgi:hypothetical protein
MWNLGNLQVSPVGPSPQGELREANSFEAASG